LKKRQFEDFLKSGIIEYMDVNEESDAHIAVYEREINRFEYIVLYTIKTQRRKQFTFTVYFHCLVFSRS
jgi:DNA-directed RNA polymerase beta subunit